MSRELAVRVLGLYAPVVTAGALWILRYYRDSIDARRLGTAVLLACAWNAPALLALQLAAARAGWWSFEAESGLFAGTPFDLYLGWIILWGAVPTLAFPRLSLSALVTAMVTLDMIVMPLCEPVVRLGSWWFVGEAVAVSCVLIPSQLLARWTLDDRRLGGRALLQVIAFSGLILLVIPVAVLEQTGGSWTPLLEGSARWTNAFLQLVAIPAGFGLSAVQEFVVRGRGTPIPFDPPRRLVTSGPYAYIANPMQVATVLVLLVWAMMLQSMWMLGPVAMTLIYGTGLASWDENSDLAARFGRAWINYRREVRQWWPRWRPYCAAREQGDQGDQGVVFRMPQGGQGDRGGISKGVFLPDLPDLPVLPARLYVAQSCATCRGIGEWLTKQGVSGLTIVAAEEFPGKPLLRMTYDPGDGTPVDRGVGALGRALEHINLAWAWCGMFMRLPLVRPFLQVVVDASGGYPRPVGPRVSRA